MKFKWYLFAIYFWHFPNPHYLTCAECDVSPLKIRCTKYLISTSNNTYIDIQRLHCTTQIEVSNLSCSFMMLYDALLYASLCYWLLFIAIRCYSDAKTHQHQRHLGKLIPLELVLDCNEYPANLALKAIRPSRMWNDVNSLQTSLQIGKRSQLMFANCCLFAWVLPERLTFWCLLRG